MTLHQLKVFSKVARLRSFTLAAAGLDVSQPSVSFIVQGLERELGAKLFEKLGNKVHLTGAGEKLLHHAEEILAQVEGIRGEMDELKGLKKGKLVVGGSAIAGASFLPRALYSFKTEHPGVEVVFTARGSHILKEKLLAGEIDVAIITDAPGSPLLVGEPYRKVNLVAFASASHPLAQRRSVSLGLIAKEPLIAHERGTPIRDMLEERFAEKGLPFATVLEMDYFGNARDAIRSAVADGVGISFLSECHVIEDAKAGRVKILNVPELKLQRTLYITVHKNRRRLPMIRTFIDFLRHYKGGR